jgi:hypothetical protein
VDKLFGLIVIAALSAACVYGAFLFQKSQRRLPLDFETFDKFWPAALKKQGIWLAIAAIADLFGGMALGIIVFMFAAAPLFLFKPTGKEVKVDPAGMKARAESENRGWLTALGATPTDRARAIDEMFEQKSKIVYASIFERWADKVYEPNMPDAIHYIRFQVARSLAAMEYREREALRFAEHLNSLADGGNPEYVRWRAALAWGGGKGQAQDSVEYMDLRPEDPIGDYVARFKLTVDQVLNALAIRASQIKEDPRQPESLRRVCQEAFEAISGGPA